MLQVKSKMDKKVDHYVDSFIQNWSSSRLDIKVRVKNFVNPTEVTVVIFHEHIQEMHGRISYELLQTLQTLKKWKI